MKKAFSISLVAILLLTLLVPAVAAWEFERPSAYVMVNQREGDSCTDGKASVGLGVHIVKYEEDHPQLNDFLELRIVTMANTRKIINYSAGPRPGSYLWLNVTEPTNINGDNSGSWLDLPFPVRFYGGPGAQAKSAEYDRVWVCSNGFISFDSNFTDPYYSESIPSTAKPDTFIAPFWRDLDSSQGGSITYGAIEHPHFYGWIICISWNEVPSKVNGVPQTFQVIMQMAPQSLHWQSRIWFQYQSVTLDDETTVGIEDHGGWRGKSYWPQLISNGTILEFYQSTNSAYILYLSTSLSENDAYAYTEILEDPDWIRGHNLILAQDLEDDQMRYAFATGGSATLLLDAWAIFATAPAWVPGVGFIIGTTLIVLELANEAAREQRKAQLLTVNNTYVKARAQDSLPPPATAVDASLGITTYWSFTDNNDKDHALTITARLDYFEVATDGEIVAYRNITTSVDLNVVRDAGNSFDKARYVTPGEYLAHVHWYYDKFDYYNVTVPANKCVWLNMSMTSSLYADLYLYNPSGVEVKKSERGGSATEFINYYATSPGNYSILVNASQGDGLYNLKIVISPPFELKVETRQTNNVEIEDVKVWIDYDANHSLSPVTINVAAANHTVEVESMFIRTEFPNFYLYTFVEWEDGSTGNPRTVPVSENRTITAYYRKEYAGGIFKPVP